MPKMKTHKGYAKKIKKRPGGTIKIGRNGMNHNTGKKNSAYNRTKKKGSMLSKSDLRRIKDII